MSSAPVEGRLHPLAVLLIARRFLSASLIPLAALVLSMGTRVIVPLLAAALLVGLPLAVYSWWRFRYRVSRGRLELSSGVLSRSLRTIPVERVRGLNVTEPFLHRLLGLVKVDVEAAAGGSSREAELSLPAVSRAQAESLREALLGVSQPAAERAEAAPLFRATPGLLSLGGVTGIPYLLAPAAVVGVVANLADDLPGNLDERLFETAADRFPTDALGLVVAGVLLLAVVLATAAFGSLLVDWDFTLRDEGERLAAARGLLTRRVVHLDRSRIRGTNVRDTPLRRPFGLAAVTAIAPGVVSRNGTTVLAPVIRTDDAPALLRSVDPAAPGLDLQLVRHPPAARTRRLVRALPGPILLVVLLLALGVLWGAGAAVVLVAAAVALALDRYRQLGHAFDGRRLVIREGSLRRRWSELDPDAPVAFELRTSPGQRRAGLATLTVHLGQGAGSRRALDIDEEQAAALLRRVQPRLFGPLLP